MSEEERASVSSLLVIIWDTHPSQLVLHEQAGVLTNTLSSLIVFGNSHLMMSPKNKLAIIDAHSSSCQYLYSETLHEEMQDVGTSTDGKYERFTQVERCVKDQLNDLLSGESLKINQDSLVSGALAMALCYIHKMEKEAASSDKLVSRILVVTGSGDSTSQYMNYMNAFFTAQKQNIIIDACLLGKDSGLLQQGCDITGGIYLKIPQLRGLLQYLLCVFLIDVGAREQMILPQAHQVDYRATCFCHRQLVEIGYVCSVCLSIFCTFSPICTTCQSVFRIMATPSLKAKKKKPASAQIHKF